MNGKPKDYIFLLRIMIEIIIIIKRILKYSHIGKSDMSMNLKIAPSIHKIIIIIHKKKLHD